jgi:uncharacterized membrane protein YcjF (UPF0283 family)
MSTIAIIAIIVGALILLAILAFVLPRARRTAQVRSRERELQGRRERVATEHRDTAGAREREAEAAEQQARMAQSEADRQRAEARMHSERADMHEHGMADHELVEEDEREHFAPALDRQRDDARERDSEGGRVHEPASDYEQGRVDEREAQSGRFERGDAAEEQPREPRRA